LSRIALASNREQENLLTQDEESSGIIEVTDLVHSARWFDKGRRYFLADMQAHYPSQCQSAGLRKPGMNWWKVASFT